MTITLHNWQVQYPDDYHMYKCERTHVSNNSERFPIEHMRNTHLGVDLKHAHQHTAIHLSRQREKLEESA